VAVQRRPFETVLAGPNALAREGLTRILRAAGFRIAASVPCIDGAVLSTLSQDQITLLVLDAGNAVQKAIGQIELFKEHCPDGRVAVLADQSPLLDIVSVFRAGANSYFVNVTSAIPFVKSLELVMLGETLLPPEILPMLLDHDEVSDDHALVPDTETVAGIMLEPDSSQVPQLSAREECILRCLTEGHSNKAIARKINIAEATVKVHIKAILRKIRVHNRTQAAIWAIGHGSPTAALPHIAEPQVEGGEQAEDKGDPTFNGAARTVIGRKAS
jgi:two-component system nitrate/nitrite response regulator NarL